MWSDLPRDVCLKAEYKEMLTNAVAEVRVECTQTEASTHTCTHTHQAHTHINTDAHTERYTFKKKHTHIHARAVTLRNCSLWVCKFDRDLADSGHLALAAEQTEWLHLRVHRVRVCVSMCVSSSRRRRSSEQEKTMREKRKRKKTDAHNDLTAGNMHQNPRTALLQETTQNFQKRFL